VLAYVTSFQGSFLFDDLLYVGRPEVRQLWPPWQAMFSAQYASRPLVGLSLGINYAISGFGTWSYHGFNLVIHILAALTLFGIVRRTLLTGRLRERFAHDSLAVATVVALVWVVHPLLTQSVTYVIQRCESMMGMFYLLTLYCAIRSSESRRRWFWYVGAIAAGVAGMLSKEVMITAPIVVVVHDVLFLPGAVREIIKRRWPLYTGLAATWGVLAATMMIAPVNHTAGFAVKSISSWQYFRSEFAVILHYIRLALWPNRLVIDYAWPRADTATAIVPFAAVVCAIGGVTVIGLVRRKPAAFLGVWFFFILSLTSSFVPFADLAFEHRMYLPLAAVVTAVVLGGRWALRYFLSGDRERIGGVLAKALTVTVVAVLAFSTAKRNLDYRSSIVMWRDVVQKRPENGRARNNLGLDLTFAGRLKEGEENLIEAIRINPQNGDAFYNLGRNLVAQGQNAEAVPYFVRALQIDPTSAEAVFHMGMALERQGKVSDAIRNYSFVVKARPDWAGALSHIALVLATQTDPALRNTDEAVVLAERAAALTSGQHPGTLDVLATVYAEAGRFPEAVSVLERSLALAESTGDKELAGRLSEKLKLFRSGRTGREPNTPAAGKAAKKQ
jgi:tetratricopeptide (TPR) repeat protein